MAVSTNQLTLFYLIEDTLLAVSFSNQITNIGKLIILWMFPIHCNRMINITTIDTLATL